MFDYGNGAIMQAVARVLKPLRAESIFYCPYAREGYPLNHELRRSSMIEYLTRFD